MVPENRTAITGRRFPLNLLARGLNRAAEPGKPATPRKRERAKLVEARLDVIVAEAIAFHDAQPPLLSDAARQASGGRNSQESRPKLGCAPTRFQSERASIALRPELDFGTLCGVAGDVDQGVEALVRVFRNI